MSSARNPSGVLVITEEWIRDHLNLQKDSLDDVRSVSLPGSYYEKITHLGRSLVGFVRLKHLDLARNALESLEGLDHLKNLETLNIYYNSISTLSELFKLRHNKKLKELDVRLNPVTKNEPDYRLFLVHMLVNLRKLDDRGVRDSERKAALLHFNTDQAHLFDRSADSATSLKPASSLETPRHCNHKHLSSRKQLVGSLAPRQNCLEDDTDELLDLIAKRDQYQYGQGSKFEGQSSNLTSVHLSPSPTRRHHSSRYKYTTTSDPPQHFDDHCDTLVKGNFTPAPVGMGRAHSGEERNLEQERENEPSDQVCTALEDLLSFMQWFVEGDLNTLKDDSEFRDKFRLWLRAHTPSTPPPPSTYTQPHNPQPTLQDDGQLQKLQTEKEALQFQLETLTTASQKKDTDMIQLKAQIEQSESEILLLSQQLEKQRANLDELSQVRDMNRVLEQLLQHANTDNKTLQEHVHALQGENHSLRSTLDNAPPSSHFDSLRKCISELETERDAIRRELSHTQERHQQETDTTAQVQQLAVMLQESHRSLVATNTRLLQELEESKQRHFQEITQMNLNYENLRNTIDTYNAS